MSFSLNLSVSNVPVVFKSNDRDLIEKRQKLEKRILNLYIGAKLYLPVKLYTLTEDDLLALAKGVVDYLERKRAKESKLTELESFLDSVQQQQLQQPKQQQQLQQHQQHQQLQQPQQLQQLQQPQQHQQLQQHQQQQQHQQYKDKSSKSSHTDVCEGISGFEEYGKREVLFKRSPIKVTKNRPLKIDFTKFVDTDPVLTNFELMGFVTIPANVDIYELNEEREAGIGSLTSSTDYGEYGNKQNYIRNTIVSTRVPDITDPDIYPYGYCYVHLAHPMYRPQYNNTNIFLDRKNLDKLKTEPLFEGLLFLHLFKNRLHISHLPIIEDTISCPIKASSFIQKIDPLVKQGSYPSFKQLFDLFTEIHNELVMASIDHFKMLTV